MKKIMKKNNSFKDFSILISIILLLFFITISSCTKNKSSNGPKEFSYEGKEMEISGLIETYENDSWNLKTFAIVENPESKSRKTYIFINLTDKQYNELKNYLNKIIKVKLKVIEEISPWTFKAILIKIL